MLLRSPGSPEQLSVPERIIDERSIAIVSAKTIFDEDHAGLIGLIRG
jgi:hypothetical protein